MFQLVLNIATLGQCHSTNRRQHVLGPGRQEAGLFHLPVGPVAQDPVGFLPLPPLPRKFSSLLLLYPPSHLKINISNLDHVHTEEIFIFLDV